jgi:succinylglutamate desuccinylase
MGYVLDNELARCDSLCRALAARYPVTSPAESTWAFTPPGALAPPAGKRYGLTLMGITHGNETAGLAVMNGLLAHLVSGALNLQIPLAIVLGNPWAARENKRFLERDLNRSFARPSPTAMEERRAAALMPILAESAFLIDFHQTTRRSERPFFIFPYTPEGYALARRVAPRIAVVTHWGKPFSAEGRCSDEYVNSMGGVGVSLELGQNGFDPYQIGVGIDCAIWAIAAATAAARGTPDLLPARVDADDAPELFTWSEIIPWPAAGFVELKPDWHNFKAVGRGETIGTVDGKPITAAEGGFVLFPKYLTRAEQAAQATRPTELCRIMKKIGEADLPRR